MRFLLILLLVSCAPKHHVGESPYQPKHTRAELALIFLGHQLPDRLPDVVLGNQITTITNGIESVAEFFPGGDRLAIYHQGHNGDFREWGMNTIDELRAAGWSVLAFSMPPQPHNALTGGYPLRHFIEPVVVGLNYVSLFQEWSEIRMVGISGGGWTTAVVAGVDPRISSSFAVAGTWPEWLREAHGPGGDLEQRLTLGYELDLYALASNPTHVFNRYDVIFAGEHYDGYASMIPGLTVLIEESDQHSIGPMALREITR